MKRMPDFTGVANLLHSRHLVTADAALLDPEWNALHRLAPFISGYLWLDPCEGRVELTS